MIMNDTTGKPLAVVTGASSGIGRELAEVAPRQTGPGSGS